MNIGYTKKMNPFDPQKHPLLEDLFTHCLGEWPSNYAPFLGETYRADLHELYLQFVIEQQQGDRFWPRLKSDPKQRDETFAEIEVAYFLHKVVGLEIVDWEPPGRGSQCGEFLVSSPEGPLFVEVKSPGWEQDIVREQQANAKKTGEPPHSQEWVKRKDKRISQGKHSEARSYDPVPLIRNAVNKASQQVPNNMPTLLIINDDYFVPISHSPMTVSWALYVPRQPVGGRFGEDSPFAIPDFQQLGGVGVVQNVFGYWTDDGKPKYKYATFINPNASHSLASFRSQFSSYPWYDKELEGEPSE